MQISYQQASVGHIIESPAIMFSFEQPHLAYPDMCELAKTYWTHYLQNRFVRLGSFLNLDEEGIENQSAKEVFRKGGGGYTSEIITTFVAFVAQHNLPIKGKTRRRPTSIEVKAPRREFSGSSWLYFYDEDSVVIQVKQPKNDTERRRTGLLILHELGHIVDPLFDVRRHMPEGGGSGNAQKALPDHEARAWWFAETIETLIVGAHGYYCRKNVDDTGLDSTGSEIIPQCAMNA